MLIAMGLLFVGLGTVRAGITFWLGGRRGPRARPDAYARLMTEARATIHHRGWPLPPELPPLDAAEWLEARVGAPGAPLRRLAMIVYAVRYGHDVSDGLLAEARACVRALRALPKPGAPRRDLLNGARESG
jgi:hypothetical protein